MQPLQEGGRQMAANTISYEMSPPSWYFPAQYGLREWVSVSHSRLPYLGNVDDIAGQCCAHVSMSLRRIMQESQFQRNQAIATKLNRLHRLPLLPVPHCQCVTVLNWDLCGIKSLQASLLVKNQ